MQGGVINFKVSLYPAKFFPESNALSSSSINPNVLEPSCSRVRFSRRIGVEFKPAITAAMVEKLLRALQYFWGRANENEPSDGEKDTALAGTLTFAICTKCFIVVARRLTSV